MSLVRSMRLRLRALLRSEALSREVEEELQLHIDMQTEENMRPEMALVAMVALLLSMAGIHALMSFTVSANSSASPRDGSITLVKAFVGPQAPNFRSLGFGMTGV